ncbi:MAG: hypothetical protein JO323_07325 [Acidobacteriia bacterium]|nr:hypothetical protein [Terriglobia bacterium]
MDQSRGRTRLWYDFGAMALEEVSIRAQVSRIAQNKSLRLSEGQARLLSYLAEKSIAGEADELKEYVVGIDAFGKPPSYDPRQESVVRTQVARLRQKLTDYYHTEGINDPILVDLPKGGFKVNFEERLVSSAPPEAEPSTPAWRRRETLLAACLALAVIAAVYITIHPVRAARTGPGAAVLTPELEQLWRPILNSNRPLVVCVATPASGSSAAGTASGAFLLGQFLAPRRQHALLTRGDLLSLPEIMMDNVVFIGPSAGNRQLDAIPIDRQVALEPEGIRNLNPRPGEPAFLPDHISHNPQEVEESLALISHTPGINGNGEIISLSGNQISSVMAAVEALTEPTLARTLVAKLRAANGVLPRYYQVVLKVKSMDDMPVEISYVFHRELAGPQLASAAGN